MAFFPTALEPTPTKNSTGVFAPTSQQFSSPKLEHSIAGKVLVSIWHTLRMYSIPQRSNGPGRHCFWPAAQIFPGGRTFHPRCPNEGRVSAACYCIVQWASLSCIAHCHPVSPVSQAVSCGSAAKSSRSDADSLERRPCPAPRSERKHVKSRHNQRGTEAPEARGADYERFQKSQVN
jgi:hypothetical protein